MIAVVALGGEGPEYLAKLFQEEKDVGTRVNLMQSFVFSNQRNLALPVLQTAMKDPATPVRQMAVNLLYSLGRDSKDGFEIFEQGLKDADDQVRMSASYAGNLYGSKSWGPLEEVLKTTKSGSIRQGILQSLQTTQYRSKAGVPLLADCLKDNNLQVRVFACNVLGNIGPDAADALPMLRDLTKHSNMGVQQAANRAVKRIETENK
jgi:HEAT repeat protein